MGRAEAKMDYEDDEEEMDDAIRMGRAEAKRERVGVAQVSLRDAIRMGRAEAKFAHRSCPQRPRDAIRMGRAEVKYAAHNSEPVDKSK